MICRFVWYKSRRLHHFLKFTIDKLQENMAILYYTFKARRYAFYYSMYLSMRFSTRWRATLNSTCFLAVFSTFDYSPFILLVVLRIVDFSGFFFEFCAIDVCCSRRNLIVSCMTSSLKCALFTIEEDVLRTNKTILAYFIYLSLWR